MTEKQPCPRCGGELGPSALVYCSRRCVRKPADPAPDRFWRKVAKGGPGDCWVWTGQVNNKGYARFYLTYTPPVRVLGHRYAYQLATGEDIGGHNLLHSCDNPPCVNPAHLRPGTQADNIRDAVERGRVNRRGLDESRERRSAQARARLVSGVKTCSRCGETKALEEFFRAKRNPDGRDCRCAQCACADQKEKRDAQKADAPPRALKTHCKWGHEFTPENTYTWDGRKGRACRTCALARAKAHKRRAA